MPGIYTRFQDIPSFTKPGSYGVDVPWTHVERVLDDIGGKEGIDLDPDFQRGHIWRPGQERAYIEFILRGGQTGREILFNQVGWNRVANSPTPLVLVDGKQRLQAVRGFLADRFPAFGTLFSEFKDKLTLTGPGFRFVVNDLETRAEVLQWYVDLNAGGTAHSEEEIERVRGLISAERAA